MFILNNIKTVHIIGGCLSIMKSLHSTKEFRYVITIEEAYKKYGLNITVTFEGNILYERLQCQ